MKKCVIALLIVCITLGGCTEKDQALKGEFDIQGIITEVDIEGNRILVNDPDTGLIWLALPENEDLKKYLEGQEVVIWIDGGIDTSSPAYAKALHLESLNGIQPIEVSKSIEIDEINNNLNLYDSQDVKFTIPFSSIPIYEEYLQGQSDRKIEIERTSSEFLSLKSSDESNYVILKYSCGVKLCSSLIIKISKDKDVFTSIALGYGMLMDMKQFPNSDNAVFRFGVNEGNVVIRNNLIPIDLMKMVFLTPESKELSQEYIENATWPITEYKWVSDKVLSIRTADIQESEYDLLLKWYNSSRKTKEIEITLLAGS